MANIKTLIIRMFFCFLIYFCNLDSMELTPVQKHIEWVRSINNDSISDIRAIAQGVYGLSDYIERYNGCNFLYKREPALKQLKDTENRLKKVADNIVKLSSEQQGKQYFSHDTFPLGIYLSDAFKYLGTHCAMVYDALARENARDAEIAVRSFRYNTELLFALLNGKKSFDLYSAKPCKDEHFLKGVTGISSFLLEEETIQKFCREALLRKAQKKAWALKIQKLVSPVEVALQAVEEIANIPDLSATALIFVNPSLSVRMGLPLAEKSSILRGLLGAKGKDIEKAQQKGIKLSEIIQQIKARVPARVKLSLIWFLKNWGSRVVNPAIWTLDKCSFPAKFGMSKVNSWVKRRLECSEMIIPEVQLYSYVTQLGLCFEDVKPKGQLDSTNVFEEKFKKIIDVERLKDKYKKIKTRYLEIKVLLESSYALCMKRQQQYLYAQGKSSHEIVDLLLQKFEYVEKEFNKLQDSYFLSAKKLDALNSILKQKGFNEFFSDDHNSGEVQNRVNENSVSSLMYALKLRLMDNKSLYERYENKQKKLIELAKILHGKKDIISSIQNGGGYLSFLSSKFKDKLKCLREELKALKHRRSRYKKKIRTIKECFQRNEDEIEKYDKDIQQRMHEIDVREYLHRLFPKSTISSETYGYYEGLIVNNNKEFIRIVKNFYDKSRSLDTQEIQTLFNVWFIYLLELKYGAYRCKVEENNEVIKQVEAIRFKTQSEYENDQKKDIKEVWHSYSLKEKATAWFYFFIYRKFPIYTQQLQPIIKNQLSLQEACIRDAKKFSSSPAFNSVKEGLLNKTLIEVKNEHFELYDEIKKLITVDRNLFSLKDLKLELPQNINVSQEEVAIDNKVVNIMVEQQDSAECGYHALYNALNAVITLDLTLEEFIKINKQHIAKMRNRTDVQWLTDDEIKELRKHYAVNSSLINEAVIFIPDIGRYCRGENGLDLDTINNIARVHNALDMKQDFERAYVICTANEVSESGEVDEIPSWRKDGSYNEDSKYYRGQAHWIAIKQIYKDGKLTYEIMNSAQGWKCEKIIEQFKNELMGSKRRFRELESKKAEQLKDLIMQIELSKAFKDGFYALGAKSEGPERKISNGNIVIIRKKLKNLINCILMGAIELLDITKGIPFHNCMGYKEPLVLVKNALQAIKNKKGKNIVVHAVSDDNGNSEPVVLNKEQNEIIEILELKIEELELVLQEMH